MKRKFLLAIVLLSALGLSGCKLVAIAPPISEIVLSLNGSTVINLAEHLANAEISEVNWLVEEIDTDLTSVYVLDGQLYVGALGTAGETSFLLTVRKPDGQSDSQVVDVTINSASEYLLTVNVTPENCGSVSDVSGYYNYGDAVYLQAIPVEGYHFSHWIGEVDDSELQDTWISIYDHTWVTAVFEANEVNYFDLTSSVSPTGSGYVTPVSDRYTENTVVEVTATAYAGWEFNHWEIGGSSFEENPVEVTMSQDRSVRAIFTEVITKITYRLATSVSPSGSGSVTPVSGNFNENTVISLTAKANAGWEFDYWVGAVNNVYANPTTVTMSQDRNIQAVFSQVVNPITYELNISVSPIGSGFTTPVSGTYDENETVPITATANAGWEFDHWVGTVSNTYANPATVTMSQNRILQAVFTQTTTTGRTVSFGGYTWIVKESETRVGPGDNYFSARTNSVWVNQDGLNLALRLIDGQWYCSEVYLDHSLGFGTYLVNLNSRVDILDPYLVLGCFTWADRAKTILHKEFDFEFTRWGVFNDPTNAQYAINPFYSGMVQRYFLSLTDAAPQLTMYLVWQPGYVEFRTYYGHYTLASLPPASKMIRSWIYDGEAMPVPGDESFRFNLWLNNGDAPSNSQETSVLISGFGWQQAVPVFPAGGTTPSIAITYMPAAGSTNFLQGRVENVVYANYKVAGYIESYGNYWNKPYDYQTAVSINSDGTFALDIETDPEGYDANLTAVKVYLIPKDVTPPACLPCTAWPTIPDAVATASATR